LEKTSNFSNFLNNLQKRPAAETQNRGGAGGEVNLTPVHVFLFFKLFRIFTRIDKPSLT
jgi:hypothetical protein